MNVRINPPTGNGGQVINLVVHHGYDFDPTTLAVCDSRAVAEAMIQAHYAVAENWDHPWNGVDIIESTLNNWVSYTQAEADKS